MNRMHSIWFFLAILLMGSAHCALVDLGYLKLDEDEALSKTRYVFSDGGGDEKLKNATVDLNIGCYSRNYENLTEGDHIRLYILVADSDVQADIQTTIEDEQERPDSGSRTFAHVFQPYGGSGLPFYKQIDLGSSADPNNTGSSVENQYIFNETISVSAEGVYYTMFLYEVVTEEKLDHETEYDSGARNGGDTDSSGRRRQLRLRDPVLRPASANAIKWKSRLHDPYEHDYKHEKHVIVTGQIVFKNSDGFLSADLLGVARVYVFMVLAYGVLCGIWLYQFKKHRDHIVSLNYHLLAILVAALIESLLSLLHYYLMDVSNVRSSALVNIAAAVQVARSTYARVVVLMVALGYQIVVKSITKYGHKIALVAFFYAVALLISLFFENMRH